MTGGAVDPTRKLYRSKTNRVSVGVGQVPDWGRPPQRQPKPASDNQSSTKSLGNS
jgi:hypothetical protein